MVEMSFPIGYRLRAGSGLDRALLVKFMQRTYQELHPEQEFLHLAETVDRFLSPETPLWWVEIDASVSDSSSARPPAIAGLWMGNAIDQLQGDRHAHIFLLYVDPAHRRRSIGTALMHHAERWARQRGDRQMGLQVFSANQPALQLYEKLGFAPQSLWLIKPLDQSRFTIS